MLTIAADPKHLGARIGITAVLHTWGSALTHHPHVHMIVPGGGLSLDGERWIPCRPRRFFLPVRVLSRLFRRLVLEKLVAAHAARRFEFFGAASPRSPTQPPSPRCLAPLRWTKWFVYAKRAVRRAEGGARLSRRATPIASPSRTRRLIAPTSRGVTFRYKDYRVDGLARYKMMTLAPDEFIRRFLLHVLPKGFHRIRHYGLLANDGPRREHRRPRELLAVSPSAEAIAPPRRRLSRTAPASCPPCPHCGGRMIVIEVFARGAMPKYRLPVTAPVWIDTS